MDFMGSADFPSGIGLRVHRNFRGEARGEINAEEGFTIGLHAVDRSLVDVIRLRHREEPDVAWEMSLGYAARVPNLLP